MSTNNYPGIGYITIGKDHNYFQKVAVNTSTFGGGSVSGQQPDIIIPFQTYGVIFLNEGTGVVEYSFNGNTVHGELDSTLASKGLSFDNRVISLVWFRVKSGSTGPITISIQAWSTR